MDELLGQTGMLVLGRRGGEDMAQVWPSLQSTTLTHIKWSNARVSDRPAEVEIPELKSQRGKDIVVFGGASFARSLAAHGLIDEYRINVRHG